MKILILNTFPVWGGDEKWTINVAKGLTSRGHFVVIASPPGSPTEQKAREANLPVFPFSIGPDIAFWKVPPFYRFLRQNDIEVVLCVQNRDVKIGGLAARLAGVPAIFGRQGLDMIRNRWDHRFQFSRYIDGIITNTASIKELYEGYGWFPPDFIHVVYDGLTLPKNISTIDLHSKFEIEPSAKVILGSGRLDKRKRFDLLVEAAKMAKEAQKNWHFIVAGEGNQLDFLQNRIDELDVSSYIQFVGFQNDVLALKKGADAFVLSSDAEGMSNALREAMSVGLPCIATDVFGVNELFEDGRCGIKVKCGDHEAIYSAVDKLFSDQKLRSSISKNARDKIKNDFSMDRMIDEIENLFRTTLKRQRQG